MFPFPFTMHSLGSFCYPLLSMNRLRVPRLHRAVIGAGLSVASLLVMGIGLFAIVSALNSDSVQLPNEGSVEDILDDNLTSGPDGSSGLAALTGVPQGPRPLRLLVPRLYIDAPVLATGFEEGTTTPAVPKRADEVAWYEFTPTPGLKNNAVFSGHVDWQTKDGDPIPGVFYRLRELQIGDVVEVRLEGGQTIPYRVTGNVAVPYNDPNVVRSMGVTEKDVITLITCGGTWIINPAEENGGNYSHRIIVRAERADDAAAVANP